MVVDYCSYDSDAIETSLQALNPFHENFKHYLYISTDSVYEASPFTLGKGEKPYDEFEQIDESLGYLDLNTLTPDQLKTLKKQDSYGFKKLRGESYILSQSQLHKFKLTCLRLADVIGPFDETFRFWKYVAWANKQH